MKKYSSRKISAHCQCSTAPPLTTGKKYTEHKDPLKSKKFQFHFFEHMCSFKNKHNRFAEKIIGAVNNFVNKSEPLRGSLLSGPISQRYIYVLLQEAVVRTYKAY